MSQTDYEHLKQILNDEEFNLIPHLLRIKLEWHLSGKQSLVDKVKSDAESVENAEKRSATLERELQNTKAKLNLADEFTDKLKNQLQTTEEALQKARHEYYDILQCECVFSLSYQL